MMNAQFTLPLLAVLALLLLWAAAVDMRSFTISNRLNLAVALLAPLYWWSAGLDLWPGLAIQLAMALLVFAIAAGLFFAGMMGGGDVKLAAALALWFSPWATLRFLAVMALAGGVLTVALLMVHKWRRREGRPQIPYGVAIAIGGLTIIAQRFLNHFTG